MATDMAGEFVRARLMDTVLERLKTKNPRIDALLSIALVNIHLLPKVWSTIERKVRHLLWPLLQAVYRMYQRYRNKKLPVEKSCVVSSITYDKHIDQVYPAVLWYLNSQTNMDDELCVTIKRSKDDLDTMQSVPQTRSSSIIYESHTIRYAIKSEVLKVHAEREYHLECHVITLSATLPPNQAIFGDFVAHCEKEYAKQRDQQRWVQKIYRNDGTNKWTSVPCTTTRNLHTVVLKEGQTEDIRKDLDDFLRQEQWYTDRDVLYTRRFLLEGTPGTGKSSMVRAIACHTKRHLHYLVLSSIKSDEDLFKLLQDVKFSETILVIEDIDCASTITHSRDAVAHTEDDTSPDDKTPPDKHGSSTMSLSGLLNAIDGGIINNHGQIMIMTTNRPEVLDSALIRPGRVDVRHSFTNCDATQVAHLYVNFFNQQPPHPCTASVRHLTPADVTGVFLRHKARPEEAWGAVCALGEERARDVDDRPPVGQERARDMDDRSPVEQALASWTPVTQALASA